MATEKTIKDEICERFVHFQKKMFALCAKIESEKFEDLPNYLQVYKRISRYLNKILITMRSPNLTYSQEQLIYQTVQQTINVPDIYRNSKEETEEKVFTLPESRNTTINVLMNEVKNSVFISEVESLEKQFGTNPFAIEKQLENLWSALKEIQTKIISGRQELMRTADDPKRAAHLIAGLIDRFLDRKVERIITAQDKIQAYGEIINNLINNPYQEKIGRLNSFRRQTNRKKS